MTIFSRAGLAPICRSGLHFFLLVILLALLSGCAARLDRAAQLFYADRPEEALAKLESDSVLDSRNQLLLLMERGLVLHQLGRYAESNQPLLQAAALIEEYELISVSEQLGSLVTTEWLARYKGEYSERLWVHSYLMMNFLLLGDYDGAYVEAKRAVNLLERYPQALGEDFFSRGLIALCFAALGEDNDALLVYRKLADDLPGPAAVAGDLVRLAERLGQPDIVERFKPFSPHVQAEQTAELVLFVATGRIPDKIPGNVVVPPTIRFSFPYYRNARTPTVRVALSPPRTPLPPLTSDLGMVAAQSLEDRRLALIAKETARVAGKEAISQKVGNQHGAAAEAVVRLSLFLLEEPDTRSWQTLPGRLTLVRVPLSPGTHQLRVRVGGAAEQALPQFELRAGQRIFQSIRF